MGNYNHFATEYAKGAATEMKMRRHFYSLLPDLLGKRILDVGCGDGLDAEHYMEHGAGFISGIDISKKQVRLARKRIPKDRQVAKRWPRDTFFMVASMNEIPPLMPDQYDIVTSLYALQAATDVEGAILEMCRLTTPGGIVQILTKHPTRNLIEGVVNDNERDYFAKGTTTSYIFERKIRLREPRHTLQDYLTPKVLGAARLPHFDERNDFPAAEPLLGWHYPTYVIMKFQKTP